MFAALKKLFVINQVTILTYNLMGQTGEREKDKNVLELILFKQ
jgi:hypothetical protein